MIDGECHSVTVAPSALEDALPVIGRMNKDMDKGGQFGPRFIDNLSVIERCQIVGDRLLTALHNEQRAMTELMAAYLLHTLGDVSSVDLNTTGEIMDSVFYDQQGRAISR